MNNNKRTNFDCPVVGAGVIIRKQTIPLGGQIGSDALGMQSDYECSKGSECPHRISKACKARQLNE